jgi:uncharacterized protein (DUF3820 family)
MVNYEGWRFFGGSPDCIPLEVLVVEMVFYFCPRIDYAKNGSTETIKQIYRGGTMNQLKTLATLAMPYGRYQGTLLIDLPEPYVVWYHSNGLPDGKLGELLGLLYEIKVNGLEHLVYPLKENS